MKFHNEQRVLHTVTDERGYIHQLTEKLGHGGQGAVFRTTNPKVVVKVQIDDRTGYIVKDEARYEAFRSAMDEVRILDLPKGIHIARPVHLLEKPVCGYVMRLLSDMVPIRKLMVPQEKVLNDFYIRTGGLRRRLKLLAETARILSLLHSIPVVYGDISPENVFVSADREANEVWLIDSDNMRYTVDFRTVIFTPGYGAPEIVRGIAGNNTLSDSYSFALLAFEALALVAPFNGELVAHGGGWDDEDEDYGAMAERGEIPWIDDEEDDSNRSRFGIPRDIVLTAGLRQLFGQTFGQQGRRDPAARPSMRQWYEALRQAADATVTCACCGATFYVFRQDCPFCGETRGKVCAAQISDEFVFDEMEKYEAVQELGGPEGTVGFKTHYVKCGFKVFDTDHRSEPQFLQSYHTGMTLLDHEIEDTVALSFGKVTKLRNLTRTEMMVVREGRAKPLPPYGLYDSPDLDGTYLIIPIHEHRTRRISFRMV
jgi:DNA-binding helix-hairpin-helix protein with protein kinase domain